MTIGDSSQIQKRSLVGQSVVERVGKPSLMILALLYAAFVWGSLVTHGLFDYIGVDWRGFMASAEIVRDHGFGAVYDLGLQVRYQEPLYRMSSTAAYSPLDVSPVAYLPIFVLAFLPMLLFDPVVSFVLWVLINGLVLCLYLRRLVKVAGHFEAPALWLQCALCLPAFLTLFVGQVNVWLLVFFGEAIIAFRRGKDLQGGIWLSGLVLKPQLLILIAPGLILGKKWKGAIGLASASIVILIISTLLAGSEGMLALARLILNFATSEGLRSNFPESMMNWRALALNIDSILGNQAGMWIAIPGLALSALGGLGLWWATRNKTSIPIEAWAGTFAATSSVAWHSHLHTGLAFLAPLILLWARLPQARTLLRMWLYVPAGLFLGIVWMLTPIANIAGFGQWAGPSAGHIVSGFSMLIINTIVLGWSLKFVRGGVST